jgi:hypothetical protein
MIPTRREALSGIAGAVGTAAFAAVASGQEDARPATPNRNGTAILVTEYGAKGDGKADDTAAFAKTLQAAGNAGGAIAFVPPGRYRITQPLAVPNSVTLQGAQEAAPPRNPHGSVLLADVPPGDENGPPFIGLGIRGAICGVSIMYTQQNDPANIKPFPWCIKAVGDNSSILNCLLQNPYQAVDMASGDSGRHFIDGLYGQPLRRGLYIDNCFDVGRVRNVHFWPFWNLSDEVRRFTETKGEAFIIGRTDWEFMDFCFCIWYRIGYHFVANKNGGGNVLLVNSGSDIGPTAVRVDQVQGHSGVSFVNGQFMSGIEVAEANTGPVKFASCGFWGVNEVPRGIVCGSHATLAGPSSVWFDNCHFTMWDMKHEKAPCIDANCQAVAVRGCDFADSKKQQIRLGGNVKSAIITSNRLRGGAKIEAPTNAGFVIGMNSEA